MWWDKVSKYCCETFVEHEVAAVIKPSSHSVIWQTSGLHGHSHRIITRVYSTNLSAPWSLCAWLYCTKINIQKKWDDNLLSRYNLGYLKCLVSIWFDWNIRFPVGIFPCLQIRFQLDQISFVCCCNWSKASLWTAAQRRPPSDSTLGKLHSGIH